RNAETASAVAAYSPRARPGAHVSTPLAWDELDETDVRGKFTVQNVPARLKSMKQDPWEDYGSVRQSITASMRKAFGQRYMRKRVFVAIIARQPRTCPRFTGSTWQPRSR